MKQLLRRDFGLTAIVVGILLELIGLGLDVVLHIQDATLAAREGVFTLSNPGHPLFIAGLALTVLGGIMRIAPRWVRAHRMGMAILAALAIATVLGVSRVASALPAHSHLHAERGAGGATMVTYESEINVSWEQLREIDRMLGETKTATAKYGDVNVALADGYKQEGPGLRGEGAHFVNRKILDAGIFDVAHPTILLYEHKPDWSYELVGVSWLLPKQLGDDTPPPYFSPLAAWHYHDYPPPGICYWEDGTTNRYAEAPCTAKGGRFWRQSPWMLHAWLFRPSPEGIFSLVNSAVKGIQIDEVFSN